MSIFQCSAHITDWLGPPLDVITVEAFRHSQRLLLLLDSKNPPSPLILIEVSRIGSLFIKSVTRSSSLFRVFSLSAVSRGRERA